MSIQIQIFKAYIMKISLFWTFLLFLSNATISLASEIDFYLGFNSSKTTVGYLVQSKNALKTLEGDTFTMACGKVKDVENLLYCVTKLDQEEPKHVYYKIVFNFPPQFHLMTENGSEYIAIRTDNKTVVHINRVVGELFVGSKISHGIYMTKFEFKQMKK